MQIKEQKFYHIHRKNYTDDKWYVGNEIIFSKEFYNAFFNYYIKINMMKSDSSVPNEVKIKEYALMIRELVYEEVRSKYFNGLPSRRHCIWLCDETDVNLWKNTLQGEYDVYKVLATGNIHKCYAGALDDENINYEILFNKAVAYWNGELIGNPEEKEYLFEGKIRILERL